MPPKETFEITVKKTWIDENAEIGHQWERTGKKDEKGEDAWGYTPSERGPKEKTVIVFTRVSTACDIESLNRVISRAEKAAAK